MTIPEMIIRFRAGLAIIESNLQGSIIARRFDFDPTKINRFASIYSPFATGNCTLRIYFPVANPSR